MKEAERSGVDQVMGETGDAGWLGREGEDRVVVPAGLHDVPPLNSLLLTLKISAFFPLPVKSPTFSW
ncbi:hypothetical protein Pcinc_036163 [Petrolisthes cinctipes]|uniref:Uncharacterized protein n=1 Tax=Petrolisthes cinctipes TaxID=88211 RepID=A0AAE1EMV0_PETCI|nr:hypothetical protein Pcinc_036163 [Petrolisthes cinctipes]